MPLQPAFFTPFLKAKNISLRSFFCKILTLYTVSVQEQFIIKMMARLRYNDGIPGSCKVPWLYHMSFYRAFSRTCIEWESFMPIPNRILFASCLRQVCPLQSQQLLVEESPVSSYNALTLAVTFCMLIQGKRFLETCIGCLLPIRYLKYVRFLGTLFLWYLMGLFNFIS